MRCSRLAALAFAFCLSACTAAPKPPALTPDERRLDLESFDYVWSTVREKHFDPELGGLDWDAVRAELRPRVERAATRDEVRDTLSDLVGRFRQSHFQILPAGLYESAAGGSPGFAGGTAGIDARVVGGLALVTRVTPASPADRAGVKPGWEIVRIDTLDVRRRVRNIERKYASRHDRDSVLSGALRVARCAGRACGPSRGDRLPGRARPEPANDTGPRAL